MKKIGLFFKKIKNLASLIIFSKKKFGNPEKKKVIMFDCDSPPQLEMILPKRETYVLSTRVNKINKIYLNYDLIKFMFFNFFRYSMRMNYLIRVIQQINPKVVITWIDNSEDFYIISKLLRNQIKFIAIQQASRAVQWQPIKWTKRATPLCLSGQIHN